MQTHRGGRAALGRSLASASSILNSLHDTGRSFDVPLIAFNVGGFCRCGIMSGVVRQVRKLGKSPSDSRVKARWT